MKQNFAAYLSNNFPQVFSFATTWLNLVFLSSNAATPSIILDIDLSLSTQLADQFPCLCFHWFKQRQSELPSKVLINFHNYMSNKNTENKLKKK